MSWLKRTTTALCLFASSLLPGAGKFLSVGNRAGSAATEVVEEVTAAAEPTVAPVVESAAAGTGRAVAAGTAAVGAGGLAVFLERGCAGVMNVGEAGANGGGRKAVTAEIANVAEAGSVRGAARMAVADAAKVFASRGSVAETGTFVADRSLAEAGVAEGRESFESVAGVHPPPGRSLLVRPATGLGDRALIPTLLEDGDRPAWDAVKETKVELVDASGHPVDGSGWIYAGASDEMKQRLYSITEDALKNLPPEEASQLTDEEIRSAVLKALKKEPRAMYEFNPFSGKLKLKVKVLGGEIIGEANAYSLVKKAAVASGTAYGVYRGDIVAALLKRKPQQAGVGLAAPLK